MAFNVTDLANMIHSETILGMIRKWQGKLVFDPIFAEGVMVEDTTRLDDVQLKSPTALVNSFDGKAKIVRVPIAPAATGSTTELAEESDDSEEVTYTPTYCDITIREYGRQKASISGKAQLQVYDGTTPQALAAIVASAADTKERLIGAIALAGGTKAESTGADSVKYFQSGPVAQGGGIFKPSEDLDPDMLMDGIITLKDKCEPFENGLMLGYIHPEAARSLKALAGNKLESFHLYQAGSPYPSVLRKGLIGVWEGVAWIETAFPLLKIADGSADGTAAYKTLVFGKNFMAKAFVPPQFLPLAESADVIQIPFADMAIRIVPNASDHHRRGKVITPYFVGGYARADRDAGFYIVSKSSWSGSDASKMA